MRQIETPILIVKHGKIQLIVFPNVQKIAETANEI